VDSATGYRFEGRDYPVCTDVSGEMRIAFVSCNGEEHGDLSRDPAERDAMWARLGARHRAAPFSLLLHGGDQLYADEVTGAHPATRDWPRAARRALAPETLAEAADALRRAYWARYRDALARPDVAWLAARVPSLAIWDDHDICDGWGSLLHGEERTPLGRALFAAAREAYLLFQHATVAGDLPPGRLDPSGAQLGWRVDLPGLTLIAPDLRSERTRRRIMSPEARGALRASLAAGAAERVLLISSVPLLGPRLSLVERAMRLTPWMEKYEDDLRDQWQSYAHRAEWRRMLRAWPGCTRRGTPSRCFRARSTSRRGPRWRPRRGRSISWWPPASRIARRPGPMPTCSARWPASARRPCPATRSACARCRARGGSTPRSATS